MKVAGILSCIFAALPALVSAVVVPGAATPLFYLVATGPDSGGVNFLPVRLHGGSSTYSSILTGNGPIGKFFFYQGNFVALDPAGTTYYWRPNIGSTQTSTGCSTWGNLGFVQGGSTNKCARYSSFQIQSNQENSQLGAKLVFNYAGGFFVCGTEKSVVYKVSPSDGPTDCTPVDLYTVPVVE